MSSKRQRRNGPKLSEVESTNVPGEQGARLGWCKVNWSHTMGAFPKLGRSAAAEGNSNSWCMNVLSVVSKTGDRNHRESWYPPRPN